MAYVIVLTVEDIQRLVFQIFVLWLVYIFVERLVSFVTNKIKYLFERVFKQRREEKFKIYFCFPDQNGIFREYFC